MDGTQGVPRTIRLGSRHRHRRRRARPSFRGDSTPRKGRTLGLTSVSPFSFYFFTLLNKIFQILILPCKII